jgi:hypothetical protein
MYGSRGTGWCSNTVEDLSRSASSKQVRSCCRRSTCFASTCPRSNDSFLYRRFLVFLTISGNLLLARSKPRELNYIGFLHSKNTVA